MAGYRLAPRAARARRNPWQRRRYVAGVAVIPAVIPFGASNATATGSLSLTAPQLLSFTASSATATGTLDLTTTSSAAPRAAPAWLGLFITDSSGASVPLIAGGSTGVATGSLALLVPSPRLISGSSQAVARGSLALTVGGTGAAYIGNPTTLESAQFGSGTLESAQYGSSTLLDDALRPV